jgi:hypothetical protein
VRAIFTTLTKEETNRKTKIKEQTEKQKVSQTSSFPFLLEERKLKKTRDSIFHFCFSFHRL